MVISHHFIYKFFKDSTNHRIRLTGWQFLAEDLSPTFLNTGTTNETFQQCGKQNFLRHILKSSANRYETSGSQFLKPPLDYSQDQMPLMNQVLL